MQRYSCKLIAIHIYPQLSTLSAGIMQQISPKIPLELLLVRVLKKKFAVDKIIKLNPALKVGKCVILWE